MLKKRLLFLLAILLLALAKVSAQQQPLIDDNPFIAFDVPTQNLLKFNRFLINPTFSTVREDKSYVNLFHRNESASFNDNNQTYFLSYSGRIGDKSGLGIGVYNQREGIVSNFGVLANYAYGVKLSDKSNFTFGANVSYYRSGFDEARANPVQLDDPLLRGFQDSNLLTFQPGFNLSYQNFDFGVVAENLFDYNIRTSQSITNFAEKTFSGHLQYTYPFKNGTGLFEEGRILPLARVRKVGEADPTLGGSLVLDLPKLGWLQAGYDDFYGASAGIGFNLGKKISLGYTMERGLSNTIANLGITHEINLAYSFTPRLTEDRVQLENEDDEDLALDEEDTEDLAQLSSKDDEIEELKRRLAENDEILAELMFRQDSIEDSRNGDLERRFEMVMKMVKNSTDGNPSNIEKKAEQLYFVNNDDTPSTAVTSTNTDLIEKQQDAIEASNISDVIEDKVAATSIASNTGESAVQNSENTLSENNRNPQTKTSKGIILNNTVADNNNSSSENNRNPQTKTSKGVILNNTVADNNNSSNTTPAKTYSNVSTGNSTNTVARGIERSNQPKRRTFKNLEGVEDGYYIIANVYKGRQYLDRFVDKLGNQGISADYIDNPKNGLKYVYLDRYDTWQEAVDAYSSNVNGTYEENLWVMNVENRYTNEAYAENVNNISKKSSKYDTDATNNNTIARDKLTTTVPNTKGYIAETGDTNYYIIANVFANPKNANRFVEYLNAQGLNASYFINPENNWRYVYLKKHVSWNNALISYYSKINDAYDDKMWIMRTKSNQLS